MLSLQRARTGRLGLHHADLNTTPGDDAQTRDQIGQVTGDLLSEISTRRCPRDRMGSGRLEMAARLRDLTADRIVQLTGALTRPDVEASSVKLVRSVGVGGWNPPSSTLHDALTPAERDLLRKSGVHADLSGVLLDAQGEAMETPLSSRIIAITAAQLRHIPEVIVIAYGLDKVSAAHAAIQGGHLHGLVNHTDFGPGCGPPDGGQAATRVPPGARCPDGAAAPAAGPLPVPWTDPHPAAVLVRAEASGCHRGDSARISKDLGVPAATVRDRLRRLRSRAEEMRQDAMHQLGLIGGTDPALPGPSVSPLGDALNAIAAAAQTAITGYGYTRADLWPLLGRFGLARHLAPARAG